MADNFLNDLNNYKTKLIKSVQEEEFDFISIKNQICVIVEYTVTNTINTELSEKRKEAIRDINVTISELSAEIYPDDDLDISIRAMEDLLKTMPSGNEFIKIGNDLWQEWADYSLEAKTLKETIRGLDEDRPEKVSKPPKKPKLH